MEQLLELIEKYENNELGTYYEMNVFIWKLAELWHKLDDKTQAQNIDMMLDRFGLGDEFYCIWDATSKNVQKEKLQDVINVLRENSDEFEYFQDDRCSVWSITDSDVQVANIDYYYEIQNEILNEFGISNIEETGTLEDYDDLVISLFQMWCYSSDELQKMTEDNFFILRERLTESTPRNCRGCAFESARRRDL